MPRWCMDASGTLDRVVTVLSMMAIIVLLLSYWYVVIYRQSHTQRFPKGLHKGRTPKEKKKKTTKKRRGREGERVGNERGMVYDKRGRKEDVNQRRGEMRNEHFLHG